MNFFWPNIFEHFKERRYAAIFFCTLAVFIGLLVVGGILYQVADGLQLLEYWPHMLIGIGLVLAGLIIRVCLRIRAARANRYKSSPLSLDELNKARSRLRKNANVKSS